MEEKTLTKELQVNKTIKTKKRKVDNNAPAKIILIISLLMIAIPCVALLIILLQAQADANSPVLGDRYYNNLDPAIQEADINSIKETVKTINNVEKVEVVLVSGTLRVNVDVKDSANAIEIQNTAENVYEAVTKKLPVSQYFTNSTNKRMYDLGINVYNVLGGDNFMCYNIVKNGTDEDVIKDMLTDPNDPELVAERHENE